MEFFGFSFGFNKVQDVSKARPDNVDTRQFIQKPQIQIYRVRQDIQKWRNAVSAAESIQNPQRYNLIQVYNDIVLDAHLTACIQQRKNLTLSASFCVLGKDRKEDEQKSKLIQTKWFREFLELSLDSIFWGYSLIQFDSLINDQFNDIDLVPRIYVKPEFGIVVPTWSAMDGIHYKEQPYSDWCIGVGHKRDLGLLMKAAPLVIWKKNAIGAWSVYQDAYGTPLAIGKTNTRDEATRLNMENSLKSLSTGLSMVVDNDDIIELLETNKQDAHQVFNELIARCNSEIAKLILGQTATTDEKSFVGSAEVQERILLQYAELDENFIEGIMNYQLIPFLNNLGFGFDGCTIEAKDDADIPLMDRLKIDAELMKWYQLTPEYIKETYGTDVTVKVVDTGLQQMKNKLDKYYS